MRTILARPILSLLVTLLVFLGHNSSAQEKRTMRADFLITIAWPTALNNVAAL